MGADRPGSDGVQIWSKLFAATAVELILLTTPGRRCLFGPFLALHAVGSNRQLRVVELLTQ